MGCGSSKPPATANIQPEPDSISSLDAPESEAEELIEPEPPKEMKQAVEPPQKPNVLARSTVQNGHGDWGQLELDAAGLTWRSSQAEEAARLVELDFSNGCRWRLVRIGDGEVMSDEVRRRKSRRSLRMDATICIHVALFGDGQQGFRVAELDLWGDEEGGELLAQVEGGDIVDMAFGTLESWDGSEFTGATVEVAENTLTGSNGSGDPAAKDKVVEGAGAAFLAVLWADRLTIYCPDLGYQEVGEHMIQGTAVVWDSATIRVEGGLDWNLGSDTITKHRASDPST